MAPAPSFQELLEKIYLLNRDRSSGHEKPHKPVLLLAVLELLDLLEATPAHIPFTHHLREAFNRYFQIVRQGNDKPNIDLPFYHMQSDGFWSVATINGPLRAQVGVGQLRGAFAPIYRSLLETEFHRELLRESIISRFFAQHRLPLRALHREALRGASEPLREVAETQAEYIVQRSSAFRKIVVEIYDYQCAACGLRIRIPPDSLTFVDAAHIIPFSETHNDHPSNGIALCKNHHWALDRNLIAPGEDLRWHVSPRILANRSTGEAALAQLDNKPLLPVHNPKFNPNPTALKWRHQRLVG